jgi:hypothetical protein
MRDKNCIFNEICLNACTDPEEGRGSRPPWDFQMQSPQGSGLLPLHRFSEVGSMDLPLLSLTRTGMKFISTFFSTRFARQITITILTRGNSPSTFLKSWLNWSFHCIYVPLENILLICTCHRCQWTVAKLGQCSALRTFEQGERDLNNSDHATPAMTKGLGLILSMMSFLFVS